MINNEVTVNKGIVHDNDELRRYRALRALRAAERRWGDAKVLEHANIRRQPGRRK